MMKAEIEESKARFWKFQETAIRPLQEVARKHNVPDSDSLTWRVHPPAKGDPNGSAMYGIVKVNPDLPTVSMYQAAPKWFYGWENAAFMVDGMPESAPITGNARLPPRVPPLASPKKLPWTCRRWYDYKYRGRRTPCEFENVAKGSQKGHVPLNPGTHMCFFVHALPEFPRKRN